MPHIFESDIAQVVVELLEKHRFDYSLMEVIKGGNKSAEGAVASG
jgi:hypothetical protein